MTRQAHRVDPLRFTGRTIGRLISETIESEKPYRDVPWTPFSKTLGEAKVALLTTAGVSMRGDAPFDMESERKRPTWGDPSWRAIRADAHAVDVEVNHLHIDTAYAKRDLNVALPVDRLRELQEAGRVGAVAGTHYSTMGFQGNDPTRVVRTSADEIAASLREERVDLLLLAPV
jgi:glycine/betaine/sarcosine/D-proline reductase family selenoprotein B